LRITASLPCSFGGGSSINLFSNCILFCPEAVLDDFGSLKPRDYVLVDLVAFGVVLLDLDLCWLLWLDFQSMVS